MLGIVDDSRIVIAWECLRLQVVVWFHLSDGDLSMSETRTLLLLPLIINTKYNGSSKRITFRNTLEPTFASGCFEIFPMSAMGG
jgi:hypothetical protein